MTAVPHTDREPALDDVLDAWAEGPARGGGPRADDRLAVAETLKRLARTGARLGAVMAANPVLAEDQAAAADLGENASGDDQKPLDVEAEAMFLADLRGGPVAAVCSEESEHVIPLTDGGRLVVAIDPVDGSGNIDINAPVGTLFAVLPVEGFENDLTGALLQPGRRQLAAGFIVYGPATLMALTHGDGTDIYALDPLREEFVRVRRGIRIPEESREYAINASNAMHWPDGVKRYVDDLVMGSAGPRGQKFNMRWLAALVAEAYRILVRGGIYLYPADDRPGYEHGRLRLVYEANPIAFLCEQAGGLATDGVDPILDLQPKDAHQRISLVFGSRGKVERVRRYLTTPQTYPERSPLFGNRGLFQE